jgi:mannosyl-3-phosphoglycerate phosphatase
MKTMSVPFERWLVFTDLDGTLLNHHDYGFEDALPMLRRLDDMDIPVIINTSKTLAELQRWVIRLNSRHPFIIENGSAVIVPVNYFPTEQLQGLNIDSESGHYILRKGAEIEGLQAFVDAFDPDAVDLSRCSPAEARRLTGLDDSEARLAQNRQYSVPLAFNDSNDELPFMAAAREAGFRTLKGGRFLHLLGDCDKGRSMLALRDLYQSALACSFGIAALGDSPNDKDMLLQADHAIIVHSPSSHRLQFAHANCYHCRKTAPHGWVEGIESLLSSLHPNRNPEESSYGG